MKIIRFNRHQIRKIRIALAMTQQEFADYLDVGEAAVPRWENGYYKPNKYALEKLKKAAVAAGYEVDEGVEWTPTPSG